MKESYKESNLSAPESVVPSETVELRSALLQANDRILELEEAVSNLRAELDNSHTRKRCKLDFSWLAMA